MHNFVGHGINDKFRVRQLVMTETNAYDQQFRRPYETVVTPEVEQMVHERVDKVGPVVASNIAGIANRFIMPSATPEQAVQMINGWGSRKLRFMLMLDHVGATGIEITQVITGWSEHFDPSYEGSMDLDLTFFTNSTMILRRVTARTAVGNREYYNVSDSAHVIVDNSFQGIHQPEKNYRMRPADVYSTMTRTVLGQQNNDVNDTRTLVTSQPVKSYRSNSNTTAYAANLLNSYKDALGMDAFGQTEDQILSAARGNAHELSMVQDAFLNAISKMRGAPIGNTFTMRELLRLDEHALDNDIAMMTMPGQASAMNPQAQAEFFNNTSQLSGWGGSNLYTQIATILSHSVPAIMVECAISKIALHCTNQNDFRTAEIWISQMQDFPQMAGTSIDMSQFIQHFRRKLETEVLNDISHNSTVDYEIHMQLDLLGESIIQLSMYGDRPETFVVPSFCDALLVPIITNNDARALTLASDFQNLFNAAFDTSSHVPGVASGNQSVEFGKL